MKIKTILFSMLIIPLLAFNIVEAQKIELKRNNLYSSEDILNISYEPFQETYLKLNNNSLRINGIISWTKIFSYDDNKSAIILFDALNAKLISLFMTKTESDDLHLNNIAEYKIWEANIIFGRADLEAPIDLPSKYIASEDSSKILFQCLDRNNAKIRTIGIDFNNYYISQEKSIDLLFAGGRPSHMMFLGNIEEYQSGVLWYCELFKGWSSLRFSPYDLDFYEIDREFCQEQENNYRIGSVVRLNNGNDNSNFLLFDYHSGTLLKMTIDKNDPEILIPDKFEGLSKEIVFMIGPHKPFPIARLSFGANWSFADTSFADDGQLVRTSNGEYPIAVDRDGHLWITSRQIGKLLVLENAYISNRIYDESNINMLQEVTIPTQFTGVDGKILYIDASVPKQLTICFYGGVQTFEISE